MSGKIRDINPCQLFDCGEMSYTFVEQSQVMTFKVDFLLTDYVPINPIQSV